MNLKRIAATCALATLIILSTLATRVYVQGGTKTPVRGVTKSGTARLALQVVAQVALVQKGSDLVLTVRLDSGSTVKVWADNSCGTPKNNAMQFTQSGQYTFPLKNVKGAGEKYVCLLSSDGKLKQSLQVK